MPKASNSHERVEFGDFQTPLSFAREVCATLRTEISPASVVEPTAGLGNFIAASLEAFPELKRLVGLEINPRYVAHLEKRFASDIAGGRVSITGADFFTCDWHNILSSLPKPILIIGNPPWVTNSDVSAVGGSNTPNKSNFQGLSGIHAITGKSNFDISEWIMMKLVEALPSQECLLAMLCKTSVSRKVLAHFWKSGHMDVSGSIRRIDAKEIFDVSVDSCLFTIQRTQSHDVPSCDVYDDLRSTSPETTIGYLDDTLISSVDKLRKLRHLWGPSPYTWRSGVKHDCSKIMELRKSGNEYINGHGTRVQLEDDFIYPMMKSSDVAKKQVNCPRLWMIMPQAAVGASTNVVKEQAPRTWKYLMDHSQYLDARRSSIYRNKPRFSIFGVGDYTFKPWKIAISGFYKALEFTLVGPMDGRPVVFDDTVYFIACDTGEEARLIHQALNSDIARDFLGSFVFWDAKRPITVDLLSRLNVATLGKELDILDELAGVSREITWNAPAQASLF